MSNTIFVSTHLIEPRHRNDFWRDVTKPLFDTTLVPGTQASTLEGSTTLRMIGSLLTASTQFNQQQNNRTRPIVLASGLDGYIVQILTAGTSIGDFNGVPVSALPGDISIIDLAQTMRTEVSDGTRITFYMQRQQLEKAANWQNLHGIVLKAHWPATQLVKHYLTGLHAIGWQLPAEQASAAQDAVVMLLAAALKGEDIRGEDTAGYSVLGIALRQRVLAFIDQHIDLPELSPQLIIRRLGVSRSHLYRAFAFDGGVATVLRNKRLDAAFLALTRTSAPTTSITEIAGRLGFSSSNQFLRAFRNRFGTTPSQARDMTEPGSQTHTNLLTYFTALSDHNAREALLENLRNA